MKTYKNYIFDLYGTLLDSITDDTLPLAWKYLAWIYNLKGAMYSPEQLEDAYRVIFRKKMQENIDKYHVEFPENKLEYIFLELLNCAPNKLEDYPNEGLDWGIATAQTFRVLTRVRIDIYPDTIRTLELLKDRGANLYLLSNAQRMFALPEMKMFGLTKFFSHIYISSDYPYKKPQREFLQRCVLEHNLSIKDCLYVGNDERFDKKIAQLCGMDWKLINDNDQSSSIKDLLS